VAKVSRRSASVATFIVKDQTPVFGPYVESWRLADTIDVNLEAVAVEEPERHGAARMIRVASKSTHSCHVAIHQLIRGGLYQYDFPVLFAMVPGWNAGTNRGAWKRSKPNWKTGSGGERQPDAPCYRLNPLQGRLFSTARCNPRTELPETH
jgi:hypothetical protein